VVPEYWWPYLYQYSVGGIVFLVGLFLILRSGSCTLSRRQDRFWFGVLIFGFLWYAGLHFAWYMAGLYWNPVVAAAGGGG
jgi:hypothetical protein